MAKQDLNELTRRERLAMDVVYARKEVTVRDVREALRDNASYSAVRAMMTRLAEKGFVKFREKGPKYLYSPTTSHESAGRAALERLKRIFFGGSTAGTVRALLGVSNEPIPEEELDEIEQMIQRERERQQ